MAETASGLPRVWTRARYLAYGAAFAMVAASGSAPAADLASVQWQGMNPPSVAAASAPPPAFWLSEIRFGGTAHDPASEERGSADINGEVLFNPFGAPTRGNAQWWIPRVHVGASASLGGKTSYVYSGFTWDYEIFRVFYLEGTFGGTVHDGDTSTSPPPGHNALGCPLLFHESFGIGYRITDNWNILTSIDHMSHAGLCPNKRNRGLTNVGAKIGYRF